MQLWEAAAALNVPVFPCRADKRPACPHGFKDAEADPSRIKTLFETYPGELVGMPTGIPSGIDALDLDITRHDEARDWMQRNQSVLSETRIQRTKSGGYHFIFRHHPGLRNWTSRPVPGVDGRADGGYIIVWGIAGFPTNKKPVAEWPSVLLPLFSPPPDTPRVISPPTRIDDIKLAGIVHKIRHASTGERNSLLFWGACRVSEWIANGTFNRSAGEAILSMAARDAGLDDIEIARTIDSAFKQGLRDGNPA